MTKKELAQRVKELEQERDLWRGMMSKFIKALPVVNPVTVWPSTPPPQTWPPFVQPTPGIVPVGPYQPPFTTTCCDPGFYQASDCGSSLLKQIQEQHGFQFVPFGQIATN